MIKSIFIGNNEKLKKEIDNIQKEYFEDFFLIDNYDDFQQIDFSIEKNQIDLLILHLPVSKKKLQDIIKRKMNNDFDILILGTKSEEINLVSQFKALDYMLYPPNNKNIIKFLIRYYIVEKSKKENRIYKQKIIDNNIDDHTLNIHSNEEIYRVLIKNIMYCNSEGSYTKFFLNDNSFILASKNLKDFEKQLEIYNFIRVHHSFLVNVKYITKFNKSKKGTLFLTGNIKIPVSSRKKSELLRILKKSN